jgi:molybdate-binding protein/DNA-binding transcriptional regulator YhcF (GntR family)
MDINDITLDYHSSTPIYQQIVARLRQMIATEQIKPGERLPSIRQLSHSLDINPNTVARAYLELEQEQVIITRRGGGSSVKPRDVIRGVRSSRQKQLLESMNEDIVRSLSQGYSPEELEAAFYLSLERWREERQFETRKPEDSPVPEPHNEIIRIVGSNDLALNILLDLFRQKVANVETEITPAGSLGGLIALQEERADLAGTHLLDEETGEYNFPYIKRILPGREIAVVTLSFRIQGLMFRADNPKKIQGLNDLCRPDVVFINRQKGAGTRVLLDLQLKQRGISPADINGYEVELDTHLAVASHIAKGNADVGLGIEGAARICNLEFIPMFRERYDLVMLVSTNRGRLLAPLLEIIGSAEFKKVVDGLGGYDTSQTGSTTFLP